MLLIIEALLLLSAALQAQSAAYELDMAPNSVDDQYEGCANKMSDLVDKKYLLEELKDEDFRKIWNESEKNVTEQRGENELKKNHLTAIRVYTSNHDYKSKDKKLYWVFNNDVRSDKSKYKNNTFKWHSLHFLLTEAIQILKKKQNQKPNCLSIYRGTTAEFHGKKGTEFRFGTFTSFSLDPSIATKFGNKSCFEINKYQGAEITNYSEFPKEKEVLIPPYEVFKITDVKTKKDQLDVCDTVFMLEIIKTKSYLNCALFESSIKTFFKQLFCGCCGS